MTTSPYLAGDGSSRQRSLTEASLGTLSDPDVAYFALDYPSETDAPITGATIPTGGLGIIGWLSAIWKQLTGTERTPGFLSTTTTGTVTAGAKIVTIKNSGAGAGTVLTVNLPSGESLSFSTNGNDTLGAITYDATGTTFLINEVR